MGTRKKFSAAEQELLRANPYTEKVTEHQISFTLAFKEAFWRLRVEGCTGNMALRKLDYDPELLGFERVHNISSFPPTIFAFADIPFSIGSSFRHRVYLLCFRLANTITTSTAE